MALFAVAPTVTRSQSPDELSEIVVRASEPRFVAPTRRDQIGRIWAPVLINGKGPFRLVLDTGASRSGVDAGVAVALGIPPGESPPVLLRGVTGNAAVPTIRVDNFAVGDLIVTRAVLPIITDPPGGADGVLGTEAMDDKRIFIDFRHDLITITLSRGGSIPLGFTRLSFARTAAGLLVVPATMAGTRVQAVIDTGAQSTIGNMALRNALVRGRDRGVADEIFDVTSTSLGGESFLSPAIEFGPIECVGARITYANVPVFEHWDLADTPAVLIGMDIIGLFDVVVIDYRRRELVLKLRTSGP